MKYLNSNRGLSKSWEGQWNAELEIDTRVCVINDVLVIVLWGIF